MPESEVSRARYKYEPLRKSNGGLEIRCFRLLPGSRKDELVCEIFHVELGPAADPGIQFEAISYVWGDPKDKVDLNCTSGYVAVPRNLHVALNYLRLDGPRILWADSVCIDQREGPEKNHQVQQMGRMFASASRVLAWQGEQPLSKPSCLDAFERLFRLLMLADDDPQKEVLLRIRDRACSTIKGYKALGLDIEAVAELCVRPYFSRLWIVQEVRLAKEVVLICGSESKKWPPMGFAERYNHAIWMATNVGIVRRLRWQTSLLQNVQDAVVRARETSKGNAWKDPFNAMSNTDRLSCTDRRDRLFALLGLIDDIDPERDAELMPDYDASYAQMLLRMCGWHNREIGDLHYLNCARGVGRRAVPESWRRLPDPDVELDLLPSWVPDFEDWRGFRLAGQLFNAQLSAGRSSWPGCDARLQHSLCTGSSPGPEQPRRHRLRLACKVVDALDLLTHSVDGYDDEQECEDARDVLLSGSRCIRQYGGCMHHFLPWLRHVTNLIVSGHLDLADSASQSTLRVLNALLGSDADDFVTRYSESDRLAFWQAILALARTPLEDLQAASKPRAYWHTNLSDNVVNIIRHFLYYRFVRTEQGRLGYVTENSQPGDRVCVAVGADTPHVIRPTGNGDGTYWFVGECCLEGLMNGEALEMDVETELIDLV